jgi:tetratricopeptide (TPR) repeat protein
MLTLPDVTLCCVDTANHALALRALNRSRVGVAFARTLLLTSELPAAIAATAADIDVVPIAPITSREDYSDFVLKSLLPYVATAHVLLVQWDGYVTNPAAWDPAFLECDYIGAKWFWYDDGMRVGNGGFSLRSRKLLEALQDPRIVRVDNEDTTIGRSFRPLLEREHGIRFATEEVADRFSFEAAYPIGKPFGFHGLYNFCRVVAPDEIAALCPHFSDAIARSPQLLQLLRNCSALGQWQAAAAIGRRIVAASPDAVEARTLLATAERRASAPMSAGRNDPCPCGSGKKFKQCHGSLSAPPATLPADADTLARAAIAAHRAGKIDEAERGYRAALSAAPDHPLASHYLGVVLYQRDRVAEAIPLLERSAAAFPLEPEFHTNLGLALAAADRHDEAIAAYRRALELKPAHATAWNNLGLVLNAALRLPEAVAAFREAIAHKPDFAQAHWNLALALLTQGEYREGWREYRWRESIVELAGQERRYAGPRWDGVVREGMTLLITAEQGLGDMLQFIRLVELLARNGVTVLVSAPRALMSLLATAPGVARVFGPQDSLPAYDARAPLLALADAFGINASTIPAKVPYLTPDAGRCAAVANALSAYAGRRKIGLAWAGNRAHANDRRRSIPLPTLAPLLGISEAAWFSLQPIGDDPAAAALNAASELIRLPVRSEFDGTAALVSQLDLVITVDTSIAHLAGALAKPTWALLPFAPDWRWQTRRTDSPWYPTARLFRQPRPGDWHAVVRDVLAALRQS